MGAKRASKKPGAENYLDPSKDNSMIFQLVSLLKSEDNQPPSVQESSEQEEVSDEARREREKALAIALILVIRERFTGVKDYQEANLPEAYDQGLVSWLRALPVKTIFDSMGKAGGWTFSRYENSFNNFILRFSRPYGYDWRAYRGASEEELQNCLARFPALYDCLQEPKLKAYLVYPYALALLLGGASFGAGYGFSLILPSPGGGFAFLCLVAGIVTGALLTGAIASFVFAVNRTHAHRQLTALMKNPGAKMAIELYDRIWMVRWRDEKHFRRMDNTVFDFLSSKATQSKEEEKRPV